MSEAEDIAEYERRLDQAHKGQLELQRRIKEQEAELAVLRERLEELTKKETP